MKRLFLVGESLPLKDSGDPRKASPTTNLGDRLVPLDPRHGVFPNFVMKPLFGAAYSLSIRKEDALSQYFRQVTEVVSDISRQRFNLFEDRATKSKGSRRHISSSTLSTDTFALNPTLMGERIELLDRKRDLWLVFGHQTNFGLFRWLVEGKASLKTQKATIADWSRKFITVVREECMLSTCDHKNQLCCRTGALHRLCTGDEMQPQLLRVIQILKPKADYCPQEICKILRITVPLLHNEGYQDGKNPTGNAQAHFVSQAKGRKSSSDLYWQVMGDAIATRLLGEFVS